MKIILCSTYVPFYDGGARNIVEWLLAKLREAGHSCELIYLPQVDTPSLLFRQMHAFRWLDLSAADRLICFRPQAHVVPHPHKILWFIHHIRAFYDLWDSPYRNFPADLKHIGIREALHAVDRKALLEAKKIFTNSQVVSKRLKNYNMIDSEVLYPPVLNPERFQFRHLNDEIVSINRLEHHKRQHLLIDAMRYVKTPVKLRLCGIGAAADYGIHLKEQVAALSLETRVVIENRWISEDEKTDLLADCLAVANIPLDEDSYGYLSIEASHASKAVLTAYDSGGLLELVEDNYNGYVSEPEPRALAERMDKLYKDRDHTLKMGLNAKNRLNELNISWEHVLERLLS